MLLNPTTLERYRGVPKVAVDFIKEAEPYQGAGNPLWRLHQLDITDKHKLLVPVGMAHWALSANALSLPRTDGELLQQAVIPTFQTVLGGSVPVSSM